MFDLYDDIKDTYLGTCKGNSLLEAVACYLEEEHDTPPVEVIPEQKVILADIGRERGRRLCSAPPESYVEVWPIGETEQLTVQEAIDRNRPVDAWYIRVTHPDTDDDTVVEYARCMCPKKVLIDRPQSKGWNWLDHIYRNLGWVTVDHAWMYGTDSRMFLKFSS